MKKTAVSKYLAGIGRKGGEKSKRELTPEQAKAMVKAREKKRKAKDAGKLRMGRMHNACLRGRESNNGFSNLSYSRSLLLPFFLFYWVAKKDLTT